MIRVLVADDKALVRDGICALLGRSEDLEVLGAARDGIEAVELAHTFHPDVVTMDLRMPRLDGFEATKQITTRDRSVRVVVVAMSYDEPLTRRALESGALGYIAKTDMFQEIVPSIRAVHEGGRYFSASVSKLLGPQGSKATPPFQD